MTYFKNVELASRYNISESTVRNWVKIAKEGKLDLTLSEHKGRSYVANLPSNIPIIERLVEENKKYRNSRSARTVTPKKEFYTLFSQSQIYDIVRSLEIHHEIPRQYNYFDGGADEWDNYTNELASEDVPNLLNRTISLLSDNQGYIDKRLTKYKQINVVDIGVGNALPVKDLLAHLLELGIMGRYIAIDISPEMLSIAKNNIDNWFEGQVDFEPHQIDITFERFAPVFAEDYLQKGAKDTANLILFLGGTADNLRVPDDAFRTISESMNPNDFLIYSNKLETEEMLPEWFEYEAKPGKLTLAERHRLVFDLLNIDESFYDVEVGFDKKNCQRYTRTRLKVALTLKFDFEDGERLVELEKGDTILLWRSWQMTAKDAAEQFDRTGFYVLHSSQTEDHEYILTISEVKRG
jgi:uncharacterized SAM-dependent methyltransferase/transposase